MAGADVSLRNLNNEILDRPWPRQLERAAGTPHRATADMA